MVQTKTDILVMIMLDNGIEKVNSRSDILDEVYDELTYQGRQPSGEKNNWKSMFIYDLRKDDRFEKDGKEKVKCGDRTYNVSRYRIKENVKMPERDFVREQDVIYVLEQKARRGQRFVTIEEVHQEFDCKYESVKTRMNQMAKLGLLSSRTGKGYMLKEE